MPPLFQVSSAANRESIRSHGLDWTRMGAARGIAGSTTPEENGVFLCRDEFEARFFTDLNNTGGLAARPVRDLRCPQEKQEKNANNKKK